MVDRRLPARGAAVRPGPRRPERGEVASGPVVHRPAGAGLPGRAGRAQATSELVDQAVRCCTRPPPAPRATPTSSARCGPSSGHSRLSTATEPPSGGPVLFEPPDEQWLDLDLDQSVLGGGGGTVPVRTGAAGDTRAGPGVDAEGVRSRPSTPCRPGLLLAPLPRRRRPTCGSRLVQATGADAATARSCLGGHAPGPGCSADARTVPDPVDPGDSLVMRLDPPRRACLDLGPGSAVP